ESLLDLGSGPGTVLWAAYEIFPQIQHLLLIEQDSQLIELGKRLLQEIHEQAFREAVWVQGNILQETFPKSDLIVISYAVGELPAQELSLFIEKAWHACQKVLVVIEPGTMAGFARIRATRSQLIALGANPVA